MYCLYNGYYRQLLYNHMLQVMSNVDINVDNVDISIGGAVCVLCAL